MRAAAVLLKSPLYQHVFTRFIFGQKSCMTCCCLKISVRNPKQKFLCFFFKPLQKSRINMHFSYCKNTWVMVLNMLVQEVKQTNKKPHSNWKKRQNWKCDWLFQDPSHNQRRFMFSFETAHSVPVYFKTSSRKHLEVLISYLRVVISFSGCEITV